jgi:2-polyprenyl-6-methoxyphenol hydroxylase-like FAD-dependent oxidoreductase
MDRSDDYLENVAIIGGGLGVSQGPPSKISHISATDQSMVQGCALALDLAQKGITPTIFESRPEEVSSTIPSGVILTPNGLRILDHLGVLARIRERCYILTHRIFLSDDDEVTKKVPVGDDGGDGYRNHRVWRSILLEEMRVMLKEREVGVQYESKFHGIVSEDGENGVSFLINESVHHASLVIGSDGINSSVRRHLAPDVVPEYTGLLGIIAHIKRSSVAWPYEPYPKNATIQSKPGAIFWIAEDPEGEDLMVGKQVQYPEQSREDLESLQADAERLAGFYRKDYEQYGPTARKVIDSVCATAAGKEGLYAWPFMKMPRIPRWYSDSGRVVMVGDAVHALPPSSGQGVNQALEDVYSLSLLLSGLKERRDAAAGFEQKRYLEGLEFWQRMRQERIDKVFDWTVNGPNASRLPEAERKRLVDEGKVQEGQGEDMSWLYKPNIEDAIERWLGIE